MTLSTTPASVADVFLTIGRQIESKRSLSGADFPCVGRLAHALRLLSQDDDLGVMVLSARLSPRDDVATMAIRVAPGVASIGLQLPSALSGMSAGAVGSAIVQCTGALRLPITLEEELFALNIGLRPEWGSDGVAARILHDLRGLWLYAMQAALNLGGFGPRSMCSVLSSDPLPRIEVARVCGDSPISVIQADSRLDGRILSFVESLMTGDELHARLVAAGFDVVGSSASEV